jgi:hypothetical protein|tara:strand:- start:438 stop:626 length:189 start_codon:yes stop_codon:yes gene_type:complete
VEEVMFYETKIFNRKGKLTKRLTTEQLSERHWKIFQDNLEPFFKKQKNKSNTNCRGEKDFNF